MARRPATLLLLACLLQLSSALQLGVAHPRSSQQRCAVRLQGAAPAVPKTKQVTKTGPPQVGKPQGKQKIKSAKPLPKQHSEEVPMWKVILLGDEEYEPDPVCDVLVKVIPDIENVVQAKDKYEEAMGPVGKSLLMICPKEHAEGYAEQLIRADPEMMVFAEIEEE